MAATLNPSEETQLRQTIEMFEVITQSQPLDYQSLEILKEAYLKLDMEKEVIQTSNRIAQAYIQLGQVSSAILEYETILQRHPDNPEALAAMAQIENKADNLSNVTTLDTELMARPAASTAPKPLTEIDDGRQTMYKMFVEGKLVTSGDFQLCWQSPNLTERPAKATEPFIHRLSEKGIIPLEKSLRLLSDRCRMAFFHLDQYDLDIELARRFPRDACLRWCVVPFDHMSKSVMIATANPFNKQAVSEMEQATKMRVLWYLASPVDLLKLSGKVFR
jgi:tetratricopeptide (TPR) repeat protein